MQPLFPLLPFVQIRAVLERCNCKCALMASYGDTDLFHNGMPSPTLYAIEREVDSDIKAVVVHVWDEQANLPLDVFRYLVDTLELDPEMFYPSH